MKHLLFAVCLLAGLVLTNSVQTSERRDACFKLCKCEVRPWFSPSSSYNEAPTVDCNDLELLALPERLPADTQVLLSQANNIAAIDSSLEYLVNLTEVDLSRNNISSLRDINLGHLPQLLSLHLEENQLSSLHENCLGRFPNLQELYVNHNLLSLISAEAFRGLNKLFRLHLNANQLTAIRTEWFHDLSQLEILMIGENPIVRLQDMNFKSLVSLRSLVLTRMNLTQIPDRALDGLHKLESISFYDNMFPKVPQAALRQVQNLKFLDLNKNPIERIQKGDFVDMIHLKELGINSMPVLVSIDRFAVHNLPELTKIEATNNPRLSYIHPNAFSKLPRLESLMLNSNALRALHRLTVESLPNLQEVSMHSNPIYCDCVNRWINMNNTKVRFMEPDALFCAGPSEFEGHPVRRVHVREMADICLPLISPESLPDRVTSNAGRSVSLHCRALADPEPEIYWVTPWGEKISPQTVSNKFYLHPEGTFDIYDITEKEAGQYTCVAHNLIGSDTRSVSVVVNGHYPALTNKSLHIQVKGTQPRSVSISWVPPKGCLVSNINWWAASKRPYLQLAAHVLSPVRAFNLTQLKPQTRYVVCVQVTDLHGRHLKDCLNISTTEDPLSERHTDGGNDAITAATVLLLMASAAAWAFICTLQTNNHLYKKLTRQSELLPSYKPNRGSKAKITDSQTDLIKNSI